MAECKRVIWNKPHFLLLAMLLILNLVFSLLQCNDTQQITLTEEALERYVEEYPTYIEQTLENAENMKTLGLLGNPNSYAKRNLIQTVTDFESMRDVVPRVGENRGIMVLFSFEMPDFLLIGYGIFIVLRFAGEHKRGLTLVIFSTKNGRMALGVQRIGILLVSLLGAAVLIYTGTMLTVFSQYPISDLSRPIQSIPEFMKSTLHLSIAQYLLARVCVKYLAAACILLLFFALVGIFRNGIATFAFGGVVVAEYLGYRLIQSTSVWNRVKYINLYSLLRATDGFSVYYNLNIFQKPVGLLKMELCVGFLFLIAMMVLSLLVHSGKPMEAPGFLVAFTNQMKHLYEKHKPCMPAFFWEGKKLLIGQKGLMILAVIFYLAVSAANQTQYLDFRNRMEVQYYETYAGKVTHEKIREMEQLEAKMDKWYQRCVDGIEKVNNQMAELQANGEEIPSALSSSLSTYELRQREYQVKLDGLRPLIENMKDAEQYMTEKGIEFSVVEPFAYEMLFTQDERTYHRSRLYCLLCMVLVFSGIMCCEKMSHMEELMHTQAGGRTKVLVHKIIWVVIVSVLFSLPIYLIQYFAIGRIFPFVHTEGVVQSLQCLRTFPFVITLRTYLILFYGCRCGLSVVVGLLVMLIGKKCKSRMSVLAISGALFILPLVLGELLL